MLTITIWNVLMVEDNPGDVHLAKMCAEKRPRVVLHTVPNAVQAHQYLRRKSPFTHAPVPDLVLLDLHMPIYDGSPVLETLRESGSTLATIPVVVFTSSRLLLDRARCKQLGATDYVNKPTDWPEWEATIHQILHKHLPGFAKEYGP